MKDVGRAKTKYDMVLQERDRIYAGAGLKNPIPGRPLVPVCIKGACRETQHLNLSSSSRILQGFVVIVGAKSD